MASSAVRYAVAAALVVAGTAGAACAREGGSPMAFTLRSAAFAPNAAIPSQHTCEGTDVSPPLAWSGAPPGTQSFALIVDDPDAPDPQAPKTTWVHWVVYDIPGTAAALPENAGRSPNPAGGRAGRNDWQRAQYGGPCPPVGRHRYFFKLYALDVALGDLGTPTKAQLEQAMRGHVLASAELVGTYQKSGR
jgi:Raf kinase inhibitor-like YbhB/YbcL family protein